MLNILNIIFDRKKIKPWTEISVNRALVSIFTTKITLLVKLLDFYMFKARLDGVWSKLV